MMTILANAIIAPALPEINKAFSHVKNAEVISKLLLTLPAFTIAIFASAFGNLVDRYGRLKILFLSLCIFALAGTSGLWLNTLSQILIGRFFLGFGVAGIMTASTTLTGDYFKDEERTGFISLQGAFTGFGGLLFITLAGYLTDTSWRLPFAIYIFSIPVLLIAVRFLYEPEIEKNDLSQKPGLVNTTDNKPLYTIYFSAFIGIVLFYILPLQIPFYIKTFGDISNSLSGWAIGALTTAQAISSFFYKKLKSKLSYQLIYALSFIIMALGYLLISLSSSFLHIIIGLVVSGVGVAWLLPNSNLWVMAITPEKLRGKQIGRLTTFMFLGIFMSPFFVQPLQQQVGLQKTFLIISLFLLLLSLFYFFTGFAERRKKELN